MDGKNKKINCVNIYQRHLSPHFTKEEGGGRLITDGTGAYSASELFYRVQHGLAGPADRNDYDTYNIEDGFDSVPDDFTDSLISDDLTDYQRALEEIAFLKEKHKVKKTAKVNSSDGVDKRSNVAPTPPTEAGGD